MKNVQINRFEKGSKTSPQAVALWPSLISKQTEGKVYNENAEGLWKCFASGNQLTLLHAQLSACSRPKAQLLDPELSPSYPNLVLATQGFAREVLSRGGFLKAPLADSPRNTRSAAFSLKPISAARGCGGKHGVVEHK